MHIGHAYASTGSDIFGRYKRMQGYDVFQPMGFDAFGIHGENYAIKVGEHPWKLMEDLCDRFRDEQFVPMGHGYDWSKELRTYWPEYYKWTQWIFVQLFKNGLAERKTARVNWCPSCMTVLADEQVIAGACERCKSTVHKKELKQWFFKITDFAQQLLENLDHIDWSPHVKELQRNWIGKKEGVNITYSIEGTEETVTCFTTRPDTNFGATFVVIAPEHPIAERVSADNAAIREYIEKSKVRSEIERLEEGKKKTGIFTGLYALNPLTNEKMPVWISDFVLGEYGTGAVVGVPGHDTRDFEFAQQFDLPIKRVVVGEENDSSEIAEPEQVYTDEGVAVNSGFLDGLTTQEAKREVTAYLEDKGWGERVITYRLRDWLISRQRYWSAPIPIIYCDSCGTVPVPEHDLPVELPYVEDWKPKGDGRGPLANIPQFVDVKCPQCGRDAQRETDTLDNFLDSGWYFFRYPFVERNDVPFSGSGVASANDSLPNTDAFDKWFPVDLYLGGAEHAVLHLMYTRFLTMALHKMGYIDFDEPFKKFFAHGMIIKDGKKMSKSLGNIVNPDEYIDMVGADVFRAYLVFIGPFAQGGDFNDKGISGIVRFKDKLVELVGKAQNNNTTDPELLSKLHETIQRVSDSIESFKYNTAISALMELVNVWMKQTMSRDDAELVLKLLAPLMPFITEDLWQEYYVPVSGGFVSIHKQPWPETDLTKIIADVVTIPIQIDGKLRAAIRIKSHEKDLEEAVLALAKADNDIRRYLEGREITNVVFVKGRMVNFVTKKTDD
jgi:leucyl-tRNA synthetase